MGKAPVLVVDFDGAFALRTKRAVQAEGGLAQIVLNEDLSRRLVIQADPAAVVLVASALGRTYSVDQEIFSVDIPFLGICNGAQLIAKAFGATVEPAGVLEDGPVELHRRGRSLLLAGTPHTQQILMHHEHTITRLPTRFRLTGSTSLSRVAAFESLSDSPPLFGLQFHPESPETTYGPLYIRRFLRLARAHRLRRRLRGSWRALSIEVKDR